MSLKKQLAELDVKLKALTFRTKHSDEVIKLTAVERQKESIVAIVSTINILKGNIEEAKFGQGEDEADIEQWSRDIEAQVTIADQSCKKLDDFIN